MVNYRRVRVPGANYFFTVTLRDQRSRILIDHIDSLREALQDVKRRWPFRSDTLVVLPHHLLAVWTLPAGDRDFSKRRRAIKAQFTRLLLKQGIVLGYDRRGEYHLWQRRSREFLVRDDKVIAGHVDHLYYNTIKHNYIARPMDWRWSSILCYFRLGLLPCGWAVLTYDNKFGE